MSHGGSRRVVLLALAANLAIALAKLAAAVVTRSGSMLAEAIHSFADSGNQGLLLLGDARAGLKANERYPMGYGTRPTSGRCSSPCCSSPWAGCSRRTRASTS